MKSKRSQIFKKFIENSVFSFKKLELCEVSDSHGNNIYHGAAEVDKEKIEAKKIPSNIQLLII